MLVAIVLYSLAVFHVSTGTMNSSPSMADTFRQCLVSQPSNSLGHCLGVGALSKLQTLDSDPEFDLIDGLTLSRDQQEFRDNYNFAEHDPSDLRSLVDSFNHVFSYRNMKWDMGFMYPGLYLKVSPSHSPGGTLEFALDPHRESLNTLTLKEASTSRILARQLLVPFLLGFKFNVVTLLPLLFGLIALVAKKAVFLSKIALIASSAFGLGSLLFNNGYYNNHQTPINFPSHDNFNPAFGGHYTRYPDDEYDEVVAFRGMTQNPSDQLNLHAEFQPITYQKSEERKNRNFAWEDDEKLQKSVEGRNT